MKQASVALFERDGLYLAISRRDNPHLWGVPGGKVDAYETSIEALCREVLEEAGIISSTMWWVPLYSTLDAPFWVTAYLWIEQPLRDEELTVEGGLAFTWKTRAKLCDPSISPFSHFNTEMFRALDLYRSGDVV
jgi:8-oxo-dGTP pyrophosphatase MutT (NUDIX family)